MLSAEKISKTFGPQTVLKDISLILGDQERIGIVGINGAGKSTFVKILAGIEEADKGVVNRHGSTVGYLNQESQCRLGVTIADEMRDAFPNVEDIEARLMKASHAVADGDMSRADAAALDAAANDLVRADAHTIDARIGRVLAGLASPWDFNELDGRFVKCCCIGLVSVPVGISFLDNQLAFFKQSFEHFLDFETCLFLVGIALGQVFEVNKNGQIVFAIRCISRRDIHEVGSRSFRIQSIVVMIQRWILSIRRQSDTGTCMIILQEWIGSKDRILRRV